MIGYMIVIALVIIAMVSVFVALSVEATEEESGSAIDLTDRDEAPLNLS